MQAHHTLAHLKSGQNGENVDRWSLICTRGGNLLVEHGWNRRDYSGHRHKGRHRSTARDFLDSRAPVILKSLSYWQRSIKAQLCASGSKAHSENAKPDFASAS
jgi:hypothetical protein